MPLSNSSRSSSRDPWEARERERQRWADHAAGRSSQRSRRTTEDIGPPPSDEAGFKGNYIVIGLIAAIVALIAAEVPQIDSALRSLLARAGGIILLVLAGTCRTFREPVLRALKHGPNPFIILLVLWSVLSFLLSPFRQIAAMELLRIVAGAGAYLLCAYALKAPRQISYAIVGLLGIGVCMSVYDFAIMGQKVGGALRSVSTEYSAFGTHENVGSLLVLLLPPALALAIHTGVEEKRRIAAMAATLVLGGALLLARTRSAWLGSLVALVVLAFLYLRYVTPDDTSKERNGPRSGFIRLTNSPIFVIALGFVLFVAVSGAAPLILKRASVSAALDDSSFTGRLIKWDGAARMASEKPLTGWGLGSYVVLQGQWTHDGGEIAEVLTQGAKHESIAHNYYVQSAADAGAVGLLLHVACLVAFLIAVLRGLPNAREPYRATLLCGSAAAVAGSMVDAIASPAYNFHGPYALLWAWMGLGIAALRPPLRRGETTETPSIERTPWLDRLAALVAGTLVAGAVIGWGVRQHARGKTLPRGTFQIIATPGRPLKPGESVAWVARFTDEQGKPVNTMPGTIWQLHAEAAVVNRADARLIGQADPADKNLILSGFRLTLPLTAREPLSVRGTYRDRYGRTYEAVSLKTVQK